MYAFFERTSIAVCIQHGHRTEREQQETVAQQQTMAVDKIIISGPFTTTEAPTVHPGFGLWPCFCSPHIAPVPVMKDGNLFLHLFHLNSCRLFGSLGGFDCVCVCARVLSLSQLDLTKWEMYVCYHRARSLFPSFGFSRGPFPSRFWMLNRIFLNLAPWPTERHAACAASKRSLGWRCCLHCGLCGVMQMQQIAAECLTDCLGHLGVEENDDVRAFRSGFQFLV